MPLVSLREASQTVQNIHFIFFLHEIIVLQIRRGNKDNLGIIFHIYHQNIFRDPSLEPSRRDGSNEGSQHMFSLRNKEIFFFE